MFKKKKERARLSRNNNYDLESNEIPFWDPSWNFKD